MKRWRLPLAAASTACFLGAVVSATAWEAGLFAVAAIVFAAIEWRLIERG